MYERCIAVAVVAHRPPPPLAYSSTATAVCIEQYLPTCVRSVHTSSVMYIYVIQTAQHKSWCDRLFWPIGRHRWYQVPGTRHQVHNLILSCRVHSVFTNLHFMTSCNFTLEVRLKISFSFFYFRSSRAGTLHSHICSCNQSWNHVHTCIKNDLYNNMIHMIYTCM